jgi:hypothetical protein
MDNLLLPGFVSLSEPYPKEGGYQLLLNAAFDIEGFHTYEALVRLNTSMTVAGEDAPLTGSTYLGRFHRTSRRGNPGITYYTDGVGFLRSLGAHDELETLFRLSQRGGGIYPQHPYFAYLQKYERFIKKFLFTDTSFDQISLLEALL